MEQERKSERDCEDESLTRTVYEIHALYKKARDLIVCILSSTSHALTLYSLSRPIAPSSTCSCHCQLEAALEEPEAVQGASMRRRLAGDALVDWVEAVGWSHRRRRAPDEI